METVGLEFVRTWLLRDTGASAFVEDKAVRWYEYLTAFFVAHIGAGLFHDLAELEDFAERVEAIVHLNTAAPPYEESRDAMIAFLRGLLSVVSRQRQGATPSSPEHASA